MTKYNKLKPFSELSDDNWEYYIEFLKSELDESWLKKKSNNPVQMLWNRTDFAASIELYILAKALENLKNIDINCYKKQVEKIKSKSYNTCRGHCFEVIALSYFQNNYKMLPTADGNPGVDSTICYDNVEINWSFKTFGISQGQIDFENKAKYIEEIAKNLFLKKKMNNFEIAIIFVCYPYTKDIWDSLEKDIVDTIKNYNGQPVINGNENLGYCFRILNNNFKNISNNHLSHTFTAICPYHKNEEKNFYSKLDEAVANLLKHSHLKNENNVLKNALLIHIPDTIDISDCVALGQKYLYDNNKNINILAFYQTYIAQNGDSSAIYHAWRYITKDIELPSSMGIEIPVGIITNDSSSYMIKSTNDEIQNHYVYQNGDIYKNAEVSQNDTLTGELKSLAIGIRTNTVFSFPNYNKVLVASPKPFPPDNKLLIL